MITLNLRNKFLLPTLALLLLGMGIITSAAFFNAKGALQDAYTAQLTQVTDSTLVVIENWIKDRELDLVNLAQQALFQTATLDTFMGKTARKSASTQLAAHLGNYPYFESFYVADQTGTLVAASDETSLDKVKLAGTDYFQRALAGEVMVSEAIKSPVSGAPVFAISCPVRQKNEEITGVMVCLVDLLKFSKMFIETVKVGSSGYAYLYNNTGLILAHPDHTNILKMDISELAFGKKMLATENGHITYTYKDVEQNVIHRHSKDLDWHLAVGINSAELLAPVKRLGYINSVMALLITALAIVIIFLIARSIVKSIAKTKEGLQDVAGKVTTAASQISANSELLASGASEAAASLEETSSSLEEISSMITQNADNAAQADSFMQEVNQKVIRANESMGALTRSMEEISVGSQQTFKIIKTIDDIAFQTNLLALNAAVEAARAGEAGAGFAVVADEVRNLAMRAAEAAKNTATLVEGIVGKVKEGSEYVQVTNESFSQVSESSQKVGGLVGEISVGSAEQARGIHQINKAISELDKVTQNNAATAEESSASADDMGLMASELHAFVNELHLLVEGAGAGLDHDDSSPHSQAPTQTAVRGLARAAAVPKLSLPATKKEDYYEDF